MVAQLFGRRRAPDALAELTPREREVLGLMAEGCPTPASRKLFLSPKTVETHVHAIFVKLGLPAAPDDHRRVLAVLAFLRQSRRIVAQSPCAWRRATSCSAFSRGPPEMTAFPSLCTCSMSLVAFSRL